MKLQNRSKQERLMSAAARVSGVLRTVAPIMSKRPGRDAFFHMEIGQSLLSDLGIDARRVFGFAAWRVGPGEGDILSYHPSAPGALPQGIESLPYQPWLAFEDVILDFTTYQFERKAKDLDVIDGRTTCVEWCPRYLLLPLSEVRPLIKVTDAMRSGLAYYEAFPQLNAVVDDGEPPDPEALKMARRLLACPAAVNAKPPPKGSP